MENYNKALALNKDVGSQIGMCKTYLGLAKYYHSQKTILLKPLKNALNSQDIAIRLELIRLQKETAGVTFKYLQKYRQLQKKP